jgi:hypothetical protein
MARRTVVAVRVELRLALSELGLDPNVVDVRRAETRSGRVIR